jgi:hypothetical protein
MAETVTFATWNTLNALGDESRANDAYRTIDKLKADVILLGEMATEDTLVEPIVDVMRGLGYYDYVITEYSDEPGVRCDQLLSMWARIPSFVHREKFGNRWGMKTSPLDHSWIIYGYHPSDFDENERRASAHDLLTDWKTARDINPDWRILDRLPALIGGDFNGMHRRDPKSWPLRAIRPFTEPFAPSDPAEFYDKSKKFKRAAGVVVRTCRMADGGTMKKFNDAGFRSAARGNLSTVHIGPVGLRIDDILATANVNVSNFTVHSRKSADGRNISDHNPLSVVAEF